MALCARNSFTKRDTDSPTKWDVLEQGKDKDKMPSHARGHAREGTQPAGDTMESFKNGRTFVADLISCRLQYWKAVPKHPFWQGPPHGLIPDNENYVKRAFLDTQAKLCS